MSFVEDLHKKAQSFSDEQTLEYTGSIGANYPWLYVEFLMHEPVMLEELVKMADEFKSIAMKQKTLCSYDGTKLLGRGFVQFRFFEREELHRLPGDGD